MDDLSIRGLEAAHQTPKLTGVRTEAAQNISGEIRAEMQRLSGSGQNTVTGSFKDDIKSATIGDYYKTPAQLETEGFEKSEMMDMNGGVYYYNPKTNVRLRYGGLAVHLDDKVAYAVSSGGKNMAQNVYYDADGKLVRGVLQVRQPDGRIKVYNYEVDAEGNKFVKSVEFRTDASDKDYINPYE